MYSWLWRRLPGPPWLKALFSVGLFALVVVVCFTWLFPMIAPLMPFSGSTVQ